MRLTESWTILRIPGRDLAEARLHCHHAVQLNTRLARALVPAEEDDSHTALNWEARHGALVGRPVADLRAGVRLSDLTLLLLAGDNQIQASLPLDGRSFEEALRWLGEQLRSAGLDPPHLADPLHFELDDHPLLHNGRFQTRDREHLFEELAGWYADAALALSSFSETVRCWPHHFDIATVLPQVDGSIGIGMSPGDASYSLPYFYVTPWPYPSAAELPVLSAGAWHTDGWVGAVLTADEILPAQDQREFVMHFLGASLSKLREHVGSNGLQGGPR